MLVDVLVLVLVLADIDVDRQPLSPPRADTCSIDSAAIIGVIAIITIFLPMRYTFTTKGIALGEGMFYPWSDFSGYMAKGSSLKFDHPSFFRRLTLFIKPAEMNNVLEYVERYVGTKQKSKI